MKIFKRKETDKEIAERLLKLTDGKDYGMCNPPMKAQVALNELCHYFLGKDWYSASNLTNAQINTEIVYEIECKFKKYKAN